MEARREDLYRLVELATESDLATIRETLVQIVQVIEDPRSSATDLTGVISTDPPLSARLLRLANSAHFGLTRRISSIHDAVICIGFDSVKEIALTQKVCEIFAEEDESFSYSRFGLWQHSVSVALCARQICRHMVRGPRPETAYAAGLLHDIGILVIDQFLQFDFLVILRDAEEEDRDLRHVERLVLGFTHAEVGMALTRAWQFPKDFSVALGFHHRPQDALERHAPLCAVLCLAEALVLRLDEGFSDLRRVDREVMARCLKVLNLTEPALTPVLAQVQADLNRVRRLGWYRAQPAD